MINTKETAPKPARVGDMDTRVPPISVGDE
jgi:hypothetical protein